MQKKIEISSERQDNGKNRQKTGIAFEYMMNI